MLRSLHGNITVMTRLQGITSTQSRESQTHLTHNVSFLHYVFVWIEQRRCKVVIGEL